MAAILAELFGAGVTVAACLCAGSLLQQMCGLPGSAALAFLCGSAVVSMAVFFLGIAGLVHAWVFLGLAIVLVGLAWRRSKSPMATESVRPTLAWHSARVVVLVYFAIYIIYALAPEASADGSGYHLGLVRRYIERGSIFPDPSMYASLPQAMEMLFMMAYSTARLASASGGSAGAAAALVHLAFLGALVKLLFEVGRRAGVPSAGYAAALVVLASPVIGVDAASAYNDVAVAAVVFGAFCCARLGTRGGWAMAGMLAGFAFGIKYTAVTMVVWVLLYAAWKSRSVRTAAMVGAFAGVMAAPWLIRNVGWRQNPVAPFFNRVFPNPHQYVSVEEEYRANMASFNGGRIDLSWPAEVAFRSRKLQGVTGVAFLLAPVATLSMGQPMAGAAILAAAAMLTTYPANLLTRFLIPALPFLAFATALALAKWRYVLLAWTAAQVMLALPGMTVYDGWRISKVPWSAALRLEPEEDYLRGQLGYTYDLARLIEARVPSDGVVYTGLPLNDAYAGREIILNYTSALGNRLSEVLNAAAKPEPGLKLSIEAPGMVRLRCQTCGTMGRVFEAPAGSRVFENRWDAALLSDGNRATFWSPWGAGSTELDVPAGNALVSPGMWSADGAVLRQAGAEVPTPQEAIAYFRREGITHLIIHDQEPAGVALRANPSAWDLREIGAAGPARLYGISSAASASAAP